MLPKHQQFAFKAEDLVLNYLEGKGCKVQKAKTKELQYKDIDLVCVGVDGGEFSVSVKFMPKVVQTGNYAFETKLINSRNGATMKGWFSSGESDYTCICVPAGEDQMELNFWDTKKLKEVVPSLSHRTASLGFPQKSYNIDRQMDDVEILLVKKEKLTQYGKSDKVKIL